MKRIIFLITVLFFCTAIMAQSDVKLSFSCRTTGEVYVQPDSIVVQNVSLGWKRTLMFPDTICLLDLEMLPQVSQVKVFPNPFDGTATVSLNVAESDAVTVKVSDMDGRLVTATESSLRQGVHLLRVTLRKAGVYILTVHSNGKSESVKMVNVGSGDENVVRFEGGGQDNLLPDNNGASKASPAYPFRAGDWMRYVAYVSGNESMEVVQAQLLSEDLTLRFRPFPLPGDGIACPDAATVMDYEGNTYNTVQIGSQCWMKENLRTRHYADGTEIAHGPVGSNDSYYNPYFYNYTSSSIPLAERGYLYNWPAVVRRAFNCHANPGIQGICPDGWHVPSVEEWRTLTEYVGSQQMYSNGDDNAVSQALAAQTGWYNCDLSNTPGLDALSNNATGFSAYPSGMYEPYGHTGGYFTDSGTAAQFWSSTGDDNYGAYAYVISFNTKQMSRTYPFKVSGGSVRCLRD